MCDQPLAVVGGSLLDRTPSEALSALCGITRAIARAAINAEGGDVNAAASRLLAPALRLPPPLASGLQPASELAELERMGVKVYDITSFSSGGIGHAVYANAPEVIRNIGSRLSAPRSGEAPAMADIIQPDAPEAPVATAGN